MEYKNCAIAIALSTLTILPVTGLAYETPTHERMSEAALKNSVLFEADGVLKELGIIVPNDIKDFATPDGSLSDEGNERFHDFYLEKNIKSQRNVIGHVRLGSAYEDHEKILWACAHFFDPEKKRRLRPDLCLFGSNFRSPNWALYGVDKDGELIANRSDALMRDGNNRFFLALTTENKTTREEYFGSLFRNIGQGIHHIQDMTQPQHVRDDPHLPVLGEEVSLYEKYSNCKYRVNEPTVKPGWTINTISNFLTGKCTFDSPLKVPQDYAEISLNQFNHSEKFWINEGKGMAEFTNANFVSKDTNFRISGQLLSAPPRTLTYSYGKYKLPDPNNDGGPIIDISRIEAPIPEGLGSGPDQPLRGEIRFFGTMVKDKYTGTSKLNPRTSSLSIFHDDLRLQNIAIPLEPFGVPSPLRLFSLNRFTFDEAHKYLLSRAVSYSTGLINYFFRGRVAISNVLYLGGDEIIITIKNVTADKNLDGAAYSFTNGSFSLYYDDGNGSRYRIPARFTFDAVLVGDEMLENGDKKTIIFNLSPDGTPIDIDIKKPLTLIFDGAISHADLERSKWERGIAATTFYAEPLLSFDISRSDGNAPVPNVIDIYSSYDLGLNWEPVAESAFSIAFSDTTLDPSNRLGINAVAYIGNRELLVYLDYLDYNNGTPGSTSLSIGSLRLSSYGAENILSGVALDWGTAIGGAGNNIFDNMATLHSLSATGPTSLAALRISKPPLTDPPPRVRTFELLTIPDWSVDTNWVMSGNPDAGGLPELSWLGGDDFIMATQVEASETGNPDARERESALRITNDGGLSYAELARIAVCEADDNTCVQHVVPMDEGRLFGWIEQHASDYPGTTIFYTSTDAGASWQVLGTAPETSACQDNALRYTEVNTVIYLGSSSPFIPFVNDVFFIETTCKEIIEDGGFYSGLNIISTNVFASKDSARNWTEVIKPPKMNGRIIYAGDNGVVPGIFD
ncbi:MAG: hypothetical protein L3J24_08055 [Xanthomonadales bacterium]|nr:hypothetical protein [Xanthomonadales bacterium]